MLWCGTATRNQRRRAKMPINRIKLNQIAAFLCCVHPWSSHVENTYVRDTSLRYNRDRAYITYSHAPPRDSVAYLSRPTYITLKSSQENVVEFENDTHNWLLPAPTCYGLVTRKQVKWILAFVGAFFALSLRLYTVISTHQYRVKVVGVAVRIRFVDSKCNAVSEDRHQYQILERSVDDSVKEYNL